MARRVLVAMLAVALGVLGAAWFAEGTFAVTRSVRVGPPTSGNESWPRLVDGAEMIIECGPTSSRYVTEDGATRFFSGAEGSPESPGPLCEDARSQRRPLAVAFVLIGLLGGGAVIVVGRAREHRDAERLQVRPVGVGAGTHRYPTT